MLVLFAESKGVKSSLYQRCVRVPRNARPVQPVPGSEVDRSILRRGGSKLPSVKQSRMSRNRHNMLSVIIIYSVIYSHEDIYVDKSFL